jgi:hypothetical protein
MRGLLCYGFEGIRTANLTRTRYATRKTARRVKVWELSRPPLLVDPTTFTIKLDVES